MSTNSTTCVVPGCGSKSDLFSFPKEQKKRDEWLVALKLDKNNIKIKNIKICVKHFKDTDVNISVYKKRLSYNAIPFISSFVPILNKTTTTVENENVRGLKRKMLEDLKLQTKYQKLDDSSKSSSKSVKNMKRQLMRQKQKVQNLKEALDLVQEHHEIDPQLSLYLKECADDVTVELIKRAATNKNKNKISTACYSPKIKAFAFNLYFYSPKAYNYLRTVFHHALPCKRTILKWLSSVNAEPGFLQESFEAIEKFVNDKKSVLLDGYLLCSFISDEISVKKRLDLVTGTHGKKLYGTVDIGNSNFENFNNTQEEATEVLVFMIVPIDRSWKIPIAYFAIKSLKAEQRAKLVDEAISRLYDIKVRVLTTTNDGPPTNRAMMSTLGSKIYFYKDDVCEPWFTHPCNDNWKIYTFLDAPHAAKCVRGAMKKHEVIFSVDGQVKWKFIEQLHEIQETHGLKIGNKLTKNHVYFEKLKMKVKLATQTLSTSVSDALMVCKQLNLTQFADCEATAKFLKEFNDAFDILNSRKKYVKGFKKAISEENATDIVTRIKEIQHYILTLKTVKDVPLLKTQSQTGFLAFYVDLEIVKLIYEEMIKTRQIPFYETYAACQDHLEIFFSAIRSRNGWCSNPSILQFKSALQSLIVHAETKNATNGNCEALENLPILKRITRDQATRLNYVSLFKSKEYITIDDTENDENIIANWINMDGSDTFRECAITYITGYVILMIRRYVKCDECLFSLLAEDEVLDMSNYTLLYKKNTGGLVIPHPDVVLICNATDNVIATIDVNDKLKYEKLVVYTLRKLDLSKIFNHFTCNDDSEENHLYNLIKLSIMCYGKIKFHHKIKSLNAQQNNVRNHLTRIIIHGHHQ